MSELTLLNVRVHKDLKEAIRTVAFKEGHSNSSKSIVSVLENDPAISRELKKIKKSSK